MKPSEYLVCMRMTKATSLHDPNKLYRVGPAASLKEARELIAKNKRECGDTLGGLLPATSTKGHIYHIFRAQWEEVK